MGRRGLFQPRLRPDALVRALKDDDAVELFLYDQIGFPFITSQEFIEALTEIEAPTIHLRINSPGGDVFEGVAIENALRQHDARIVTHIDALAGSIASVIALAGDEVRMAPNAFFMIHQPWALVVGGADELRQKADAIEKVGQVAISSAYQAKSGQDAETIETWMDNETWFSATEALDAGFVDVVEKSASGAKASIFDLSIYQHVPAGLHYEPPEDEVFVTADDWREVEAALRDEGLTRKDAATAISGLKKWQKASETLVTPSTPPRDAVRADLPAPAEALAAAEALLASLTAGAMHTERFARNGQARYIDGRAHAHHHRGRQGL